MTLEEMLKRASEFREQRASIEYPDGLDYSWLRAVPLEAWLQYMGVCHLLTNLHIGVVSLPDLAPLAFALPLGYPGRAELCARVVESADKYWVDFCKASEMYHEARIKGVEPHPDNVQYETFRPGELP